jgi:hypothetical protein
MSSKLRIILSRRVVSIGFPSLHAASMRLHLDTLGGA